MSAYKRKKLFFILASLSGGGAERVLSSIAENISGEDIEVTIVLLIKKDNFYIPKNCRVIRIDASSVKHSFFKLVAVLRSEKPDAVISTLKHVTFITSLICRFIGIRHISRIANTISMETSGSLKWKLLSKLNYGLDNRIIAVSEGVKLDLINNLGVNADKICTIPNPITIHDCNIPLKKIDSGQKTKLIFVGRLEPQKNIEFLLEVIQFYKDKFTLMIVGSGSLRQKLEDLVDQYNIKDSVIFTGAVHNIQDYYCAADLFVLSSFYEGMPNVVLEALYFGLPVVAYDCPSGPKEIITRPVYGRLVSTLNIDDFARAIVNVTSSDNLENKQKRRFYVSKHFSLQKIVKLYKDVAILK